MLVRLLGRVMEVRLLQRQNASLPMLFTLLGRMIEVRLSQLLNAHPPMLVTLLGMVMEVRLEQPSNADSPMLVTLYSLPPVVIDEGIIIVSTSFFFTPTTSTQLFLRSVILNFTFSTVGIAYQIFMV
jgi:hypothetical protein